MAFTPEVSVAIILVNWNGLEFTKACLESLRKVDFPNFQVILVDNGSDDDEGKKLKSAFPEIELLETGKNLGFAGGNNVGINHALGQRFSHVLLLNNDTIVEPDFLGELVRKGQQNPKIGVVQPLILFLHNPKIIWSAGGKWISQSARAITIGDREPVADFRPKKCLLDWATGCAMLLSREAIMAAGLLNEQYFTYFEDVEWSLRIRNAGYDIVLAEKSILYHEAGASSKKKHSEGILSPKVFYYHVRNQFLLIRTQKNRLIPLLYHLGRFGFWMGYFLMRFRFKKLKAVLRGIRDGLMESLKSAPKWS